MPWITEPDYGPDEPAVFLSCGHVLPQSVVRRVVDGLVTCPQCEALATYLRGDT